MYLFIAAVVTVSLKYCFGGMLRMELALNEIFRTIPAISFSENELRIAMDCVKVRYKKGSDLSLGHTSIATTPSDFMEAAKDGYFFLHSVEQLFSGFLFVKQNAGRSLFGRQKAVYSSYIETPLESGVWATGPVFKSWGIAVTSIGNIYRANGFG